MPSIEPGITAILNLYRRPQYLAEQIAAVRAQTRPPKEVWLFVNAHLSNAGLDLGALDLDRRIVNDFNWKYYGRFAAALLARTEHVALFDDDTIPGPRWFENCLDSMQARPGILGTCGVLFTRRRYDGEICRVGWMSGNREIVEVDFVGHAWFLKREWLHYMWQEPPETWDSGEDMHLSYAASKLGRIRTYVPPHPPEQPALHGSIHGVAMGTDAAAPSVHAAEFRALRERCFLANRRRGWRLQRARTNAVIELLERMGIYDRLKGVVGARLK